MTFSVEAAQFDQRLQREIDRASASDKIPVIVRMKDPIDVQALATPTRRKGVLRAQARTNLIQQLKMRAGQRQQPLQSLLNRQGVTKTRQLWLINGTSFRATPAQIEKIAQLPEVESIILDAEIERPKVITTQTAGLPESNIALVNAPALWALGHTGQGITVAIMDTGVDGNHPELDPRWRGGTNSWFDPNGEHPLIPTDVKGHGTQVAGIVLGGDGGGSTIGVASDAQWIAVKIFDDNDVALTSVIHAGFQWLLDPDGVPLTDDAPDIVNNSWGFETTPNVCDSLALVFQPDIQVLKAAGIAVVFSAGNTGPSSNTSVAPASYPESFAVGSVGTHLSALEISDFSARGPSACDGSSFPEVVAPGFDIRTSDLSAGGTNPNPYLDSAWGTSFAAPHVSGVMALLLGAFPETSVDVLETALRQSSVDLGPAGDDNTYGHGLVDSLAAFNYLDGQVTDELRLLIPVGGEVWTRGATYTVQWALYPGADEYRLSYFDADNRVHSIGSVGNTDRFDWTIPLATLAEPGKSLRVAAFSAGAKVGVDRSDGPVTIISQMFPNGGETLTEGMTHGLTWASVPGADRYRLVYFDADNTRHKIADVGNVTGYTWAVPYTALAGAGKRFRVTAFNGIFNNAARLSEVQKSEGPFTIASQIYPNGGELLTIGQTYPLAWAVVSGADKYRLYYFDEDNTSHLIKQVGNLASYDWTVPEAAIPGPGKRFRITAFSGSEKLASVQWSDGTFNIVMP